MVNVGIIGAGRIGKVHVESICTQVKDAKVKMLADPFMNDETAKWAKDMGVEAVTKDYKEILTDPEIDAVLICSSTDTHSPISVEAIKAGKHVFCEKPIDHDVAKIKEVIDALKDKVIPDRILRQLNGSDPMKAGSLLVSSGIFIKNIYESDSYFFILYNGSEPQELIWNKTTHQGILVELNDNFRGHTYAPMAVSALAVLNDDEKYYDPNNGNRYLPVSRQKQTLQFRLKEEDNPVIVIYHLKPQF